MHPSLPWPGKLPLFQDTVMRQVQRLEQVAYKSLSNWPVMNCLLVLACYNLAARCYQLIQSINGNLWFYCVRQWENGKQGQSHVTPLLNIDTNLVLMASRSTRKLSKYIKEL